MTVYLCTFLAAGLSASALACSSRFCNFDCPFCLFCFLAISSLFILFLILDGSNLSVGIVSIDEARKGVKDPNANAKFHSQIVRDGLSSVSFHVSRTLSLDE
jgi:hypothetical protein